MSKGKVKIRKAYPPNIEAIRKRFPIKGNEFFAWDGIIYNPSGAHIPLSIIAHERVHFRQQNGDPEGWWARYLSDDEFMLDQEIEAHRAEFRAFRGRAGARAQHLTALANRLSGPLYNHALTFNAAREMITR